MNYGNAVEFVRRESKVSSLVDHSVGVSKVAHAIAKALKLVNAEEIRVAAVLHDVGKILADRGAGKMKDHAFLSGKLLREKGLDKYASWVEKHGISHELHGSDFLPTSIEEKIINYADSRVEMGDIVPLSDRIKAVKVRYSNINENCLDRYRDFETWLVKKLGPEFVKSLNDL